METFIKWAITAGLYSIGVSFIGGILYLILIHPIYTKWTNYKQRRDARDLDSYTVLVKEENMRTAAIDSVLKLFNDEIVKKKRVELDEILSITHSPHAIGHQFTLWYKKKQHHVNWWVDFIGSLFAGLGNHGYYNDNKNYYTGKRNNNFNDFG